MWRILIIGPGDVALRLVPQLTIKFRVFALVRNRERAELLRDANVIPIIGDLDDLRSLKRIGGIADMVLHFAPPPSSGAIDSRTKNLIAALSAGGSVPRRLVYISTSGVYGDCGGAWIDETQPVRPATSRGVRRVDAEQRLRDWATYNGVRLSILRAPGIYGDGRLPTKRLIAGTPVLAADDDVYTNHIHADDLASITLAALFRAKANRVYHASDNGELKMADYFDLVADLAKLPRPPRVSRADAESRLPKELLSFMGESRRLRNTRFKKELGARLRYPTVHEGVAASLEIEQKKIQAPEEARGYWLSNHT
jgi:nucleoside-diphosphate-sugar epimerase